MSDLASLDDLKGRLDWTLDADEERIARGALEDASDLARGHAERWDWEDELSAPRVVRTLVLKAAARYMRNPDGYTQSRAGDETLGWNDAQGENAGSVYFTDDELKMIAKAGGRNAGLVSVPVSAWRTRRRCDDVVYVPVTNGKDFPFLVADELDR